MDQELQNQRFEDCLRIAFLAVPNGEMPAFCNAWHEAYDNWKPAPELVGIITE